MKNMIKGEELAMFASSIFLFSKLPYAWYWFILLIFMPDLSMIGYTAGNRTGAVVYNIFHHKGIALVIYFFGLKLQLPAVQLAGIILFGHASLDRIFGYGLKCFEGFRYTHLGVLGKQE
jgi:Domain of unknown function (DUF4260)